MAHARPWVLVTERGHAVEVKTSGNPYRTEGHLHIIPFGHPCRVEILLPDP